MIYVTDHLRRFSRHLYNKGGLLRHIIVALRAAKNFFIQILQNVLPRYFLFQDHRYRYFYHRYNITWRNERVVEISLAKYFLKQSVGKRILEVGNVLAHYGLKGHDVLDKYEKGIGVINEDIIAFHPQNHYDRILSISTMEHVGWDEPKKSPDKILLGFRNIIENCLAPGGILFATMPLGYNPYVDKYLKNGKLQFFNKIFFMKRVSKSNKWCEVKYKEVETSKYGWPFHAANAILIGIYTKLIR